MKTFEYTWRVFIESMPPKGLKNSEYFYSWNDFDAEMAKLGNEGFEAYHVSNYYPIVSKMSTMTFYFKRETQ